MINRSVAIGIGILVIVVLGFIFFSNFTGHVITSSSIDNEKISNEYFKISDFGNKINNGGDLNDTQDNSESR